MKVKDIMTYQIITITPKSSYKTIWTTVFSKNINAVPVIDEQKKLMGIVTKEDLLKALYPDYTEYIADFEDENYMEEMEDRIDDLTHLTAKDLMNTRVIFTRDDTPAMRALSRMIAHRVNQLPVVDEEEIVVGMVTKGDVFKILFQKHMKRKVNRAVSRT